MELFFVDLGVVSVHATLEDATARAGVRVEGRDLELWAGRHYVVATFNRAKVKSVAFVSAVAVSFFTFGWILDPPSAILVATRSCVSIGARFASTAASVWQ